LINATAQLKFIGQPATPTQRKLQHANAMWGNFTPDSRLEALGGISALGLTHI